MKKKYIKRCVDKIIEERLKIFGAINIVGPKWCGKSETSKKHSKSWLKVDDYDEATIQNSLNVIPREYLKGKPPMLIDEWQIAPKLWDAARNIIDESQKTGKFLITGSTSTKIKTAHTGTGRIHTLQMYPMSLYESGESNGLISLKDLFKGIKIKTCKTSLSIKQIIFAACRGGWPWSLLVKGSKQKLAVAKSYYFDIYNVDILNIKDPSTKPILMEKVLEAYGRNISTYAKNKTLCDDAKIDNDTLTTYLDVLNRLYIVKDLHPWSYSLRSKNTIRELHKREFVDPSIACAAIHSSPEKLLNDLNTFGFIFETLCIRDIRVYATSLGGEVYYYRDKNGLECDCVLVLENGEYALIEIKLGSSQIDDGVKNLLRLEKQIINNNLKEINKKQIQPLPKFKMILTGTDVAYLHKSGVYIVPIGCLKD